MLPEIEKFIQNMTEYQPFLKSFGSHMQHDMPNLFKDTEKVRLQMSTAFAVETNTMTNVAISPHVNVTDNTPCNSAYACAQLETKLNTCTTTRQTILEAYNSVNKIVQSLANVLKAGCACVFVGPLTACALAVFPYTCMYWFQMYRGIFMISTGIWNGGIAALKACITP